MAQSQPYTVACDGGLVKSANSIDLLRTPGVARELRNFEVSTEGGYRRINGYAKFGGSSAVQPTGGTATILGVFPYADGVIVAAGTNIYFSNTGTSWLQINRSSVDASEISYSFTDVVYSRLTRAMSIYIVEVLRLIMAKSLLLMALINLQF